MDPAPGAPGPQPNRKPLSEPDRTATPSLGQRTGLRLLSWALISVSASNLITVGLSAAGLQMSSGVGLLVHSGLTIVMLLPAVYLACIDPLILELHEWKHKSEELKKAKDDLEKRLAERNTELAETRRRLEAELSTRQRAEGEVLQLKEELEQRVLERTAKFETANRELQAELAEQKKASEALRESEKRYRRLVEIAKQGIWTINAQGKTNFVNRRAAELLGYAVPEMLGRAPAELVMAEDLPREFQQFDLQRGTPPDSLDFRMRHKDGRELWMRASISAISGDRGDYLGALILFSDITPQKRSEQRLQDQAALLDWAQDGILLCDPNLHILTWNQGAARVYGWESNEVLGRNCFDILSPPAAANTKDEAIQALQKQRSWRGDLSQVTKDGRALIVDARFNMTAPAPGRPGTVLAVFTDVTQKRKEEIQKLREQRMESAASIASGLAQELNNSLAPILLSAQMLRGKAAAEDRDLVATIEASAQRSAELLRQALIFARGIEGERVLIQPAHLLKEIADIAREMFPRNIQVLCESQPGVPAFRGDPDQLHQALLKLCVNARDAMASGGTLYLRLKQLQVGESSPRPGLKPGPYVQFEIQDTGPAIPAAAQDKVFEPFSSSKETRKGAGLGLATVLGIVRSHGGFIELQSPGPSGTLFIIFIPAAAETTPESGRQALERPSGRGELILMVEDEAALRDVTRRTLNRHGYEVLAASDGTEALDLLSKHQGQVKLVLTNLVTPTMDGPALARAARKIDPRLRIIASSGLGRSLGQSDKVAALKTLGISRLLPKPYSTEELLRAICDELKATQSA